jgi:uncharacterized protein YcbX
MVLDGDGAFLTQREAPQMALVQPELTTDALVLRHRTRTMPALRLPLAPPAGPVARVQVWDDFCDAVRVGGEADRWLSQALGLACTLVAWPERGRRVAGGPLGAEREQAAFADGFPYLVAGQGSLEALNARLPAPLEMRRFRPNLVVGGGAPFAEDGWAEIAVGEAVLRLVKPCGRCAITTNDPETGVLGKEPLRALASFRRGPRGDVLFAQNAVATTAGELRVGDPVRVLASHAPVAVRG